MLSPSSLIPETNEISYFTTLSVSGNASYFIYHKSLGSAVWDDNLTQIAREGQTHNLDNKYRGKKLWYCDKKI